ncbi:MAG: zinc ribbon domain-containing protein [Propionibacteriaceae bacterium]|nr:zinc ribbon domain-containing protein [Propionibacteriaceae bacterium]
MTCQQCGAELTGGKFCGKCGATTPGASPTPPLPPGATTTSSLPPMPPGATTTSNLPPMPPMMPQPYPGPMAPGFNSGGSSLPDILKFSPLAMGVAALLGILGLLLPVLKIAPEYAREYAQYMGGYPTSFNLFTFGSYIQMMGGGPEGASIGAIASGLGIFMLISVIAVLGLSVLGFFLKRKGLRISGGMIAIITSWTFMLLTALLLGFGAMLRYGESMVFGAGPVTYMIACILMFVTGILCVIPHRSDNN